MAFRPIPPPVEVVVFGEGSPYSQDTLYEGEVYVLSEDGDVQSIAFSHTHLGWSLDTQIPALLSITDRGVEGDVWVISEDGSFVLLEVSSVRLSGVWVQTEDGQSLFQVEEAWYPEKAANVAELGLSATVGVLQDQTIEALFTNELTFSTELARMALDLPYSLWVPERQYPVVNYDYEYYVPTVVRGVLDGSWETGKLKLWNQSPNDLKLPYGMGVITLSQKDSLEAWWWKAPLAVRYPPLDASWTTTGVIVKTLDLELKFNTYHWDNVYFEFVTSMAILTKKFRETGVKYDIGVLSLKTRPFRMDSWAMGQLANKVVGWGFEFTTYGINYPVSRDFYLAYSAKHYETPQVTLSSSFLGVAQRVTFNLSSMAARVAYKDFNFAYGRQFKLQHWRTTVAYSVERRLTRGIVLRSPFSVRAGLSFVYSLMGRVANGALVSAPMNSVVLNGAVIPAGMNSVRAGVDINLPVMGSVRGGLVISAPLPPPITAGIQIPLGFAKVIAAGVSLSLGFSKSVTSGLVIPLGYNSYLLMGRTVQAPIREVVMAGLDIVYDLAAVDRLVYGVAFSAPMMSGASVVDSAQQIISLQPNGAAGVLGVATGGLGGSGGIGGSGSGSGGVSGGILGGVSGGVPSLPMDIEFAQGSVSIDEGNYGWAGSFSLLNPADILRFHASDSFSVVIGADTYQFVVESKSVSRTSPVEVNAVVNGVSPALFLAGPRGTKITKTWDTAVMSHDVLSELLGTVTAEISILNWSIPANRLGVKDAYPMDVIRQIVEAVGGSVDSLPDGTLRIRSKYPVSVELWGAATANLLLNTDDDIFSSEDTYDLPKMYNKFRIMDGISASRGDSLEFESLTADSGIVRAWPSPWRESVDLTSTSFVASVGSMEIEERDEEETIEIYNGSGAVRFPVLMVNSLQWLDENLGGVVSSPDSNQITSTDPTSKFSLLKISYRTRCLKFPVFGVVGLKAQFLLKDR